MGDVQVIRSPNGDEMVILPRAEYEALLAAAQGDDEDAADIAMYDAGKAELAGQPDAILPDELSGLLLHGSTRLKAIRTWRKLTQQELAKAVGIGQGYLSDLEAGKKAGTAETLAALAQALDVPLHWID